MSDQTPASDVAPVVPARGETVVVAMSGGVDSSVVAALLVDAGCRVLGVTLRLWCYGESSTVSPAARTCCSRADVADARQVAAQLGFRHYLLDMRDDFEQRVIEPFVAAYAAGRTPNPCVECNTHLKFGQLLEFADEMGARYVATGHYARRVEAGGTPAILRGVDASKDQSYVLWGIKSALLDHVLLPVGWLTKAAVRQRAASLGLAVADKPDSQDICFVPEGRYADFVRARLDARGGSPALCAGDIEDTSGRVLGRHAGIVEFTVGQRRGLGVAAEEPLYVVGIEPERRAVRVGSATELLAAGVEARALNRLDGGSLAVGGRVAVQIRAGSTEHPARVVALDGHSIRAVFDQPVRAVVPGQSAAFYAGERLLAGGVIERAVDRASEQLTDRGSDGIPH
jgi:tRNA-specific 2-thiouridylase